MGRVILHADANCFYASVECLYHPQYRGRALAVCGDPEARHGIVLTATYPAKHAGVKVGMAIWQARQVCPSLICVPPDYALYMHFSALMSDIWHEYSDRVEAFGLDESWIDVSGYDMDIKKGALLADVLRERVKKELGITVSIGVADNKVFAKLGSDMKKPDGTTAIWPGHMRDTVWPLPVSNLLYVGPATARKLARLNIRTVGGLALADERLIASVLGKNGIMLQHFARVEIFKKLKCVVVIRLDQCVPQIAVGCIADLSHGLEIRIDRFSEFRHGDELVHGKFFCGALILVQASCNTVLNFQYRIEIADLPGLQCDLCAIFHGNIPQRCAFR